MNFEQKKKELQKIADKLEDDKTTLENAAALFKQGMTLGKECLDLIIAEQGKTTIIGDDGKEVDFETK
jgi:exodeoxyribonuclease VII small subunit